MRRYRAASVTNHAPDLIIRATHRGLWYEDGRLTRVLEPGRYEYPKRPLFGRAPHVEVVLVDVRARNMTVKDQEILTADRHLIRVNLAVRYQVIDPELAMHAVEDYKYQVYRDVQLAARRALASMMLDDILISRSKINDEILDDAQDSAVHYGVAIRRADVKDLMLAAHTEPAAAMIPEWVLQAQMLASTLAEMERLQAQIDAERRRHAEAELQAQLRQAARIGATHGHNGSAEPVTAPLLQLGELQALRDLSQVAARLMTHADVNARTMK